MTRFLLDFAKQELLSMSRTICFSIILQSIILCKAILTCLRSWPSCLIMSWNQVRPTSVIYYFVIRCASPSMSDTNHTLTILFYTKSCQKKKSCIRSIRPCWTMSSKQLTSHVLLCFLLFFTLCQEGHVKGDCQKSTSWP